MASHRIATMPGSDSVSSTGTSIILMMCVFVSGGSSQIRSFRIFWIHFSVSCHFEISVAKWWLSKNVHSAVTRHLLSNGVSQPTNRSIFYLSYTRQSCAPSSRHQIVQFKTAPRSLSRTRRTGRCTMYGRSCPKPTHHSFHLITIRATFSCFLLYYTLSPWPEISR